MPRLGLLQHAQARFHGGQRPVSGDADATCALAARLHRGHGGFGPLLLLLLQLCDFLLKRASDAIASRDSGLSRVRDWSSCSGDFILLVRRFIAGGCAGGFCLFRVLFVGGDECVSSGGLSIRLSVLGLSRNQLLLFDVVVVMGVLREALVGRQWFVL